MDNIVLKFSAKVLSNPLSEVNLVLKKDESGKSYTVEYKDPHFASFASDEQSEKKQAELMNLIMSTFTENEIDEILSMDVIPRDPEVFIFDGYRYEISITKGNITKNYFADDENICSVPLFGCLAVWCRKLY